MSPLLSVVAAMAAAATDPPSPPPLVIGLQFPPNPQPAEPGVTLTDLDSFITDITIPTPANVVEWYVRYQNVISDTNLTPEQGPFGPAEKLSIGGADGEYLIVGRSVLTGGSEIEWELRWSTP